MADVIADVSRNVNGNFIANQPFLRQVTNKNTFNLFVNPEYLYFYQGWIMEWLSWYDGYVPYIHNARSGIFPTRLATSIIDKISSEILGGGIMYQARSESKQSVDVVDFISEEWGKEACFPSVVRKSIQLAAAAGTSLIKVNVTSKGKLWCDVFRADKFFPVIDYRGRVKEVKTVIANYTKLLDDKTSREFCLIEHRFYQDFPDLLMFDVPMVEYEVHERSGGANSTQTFSGLGRNWNELPKKTQKDILREFDCIRLNEPKKLPFDTIGCECVRFTEGISNLPDVQMGESILNNIMSYLYMYDFYASCFNTDLYMGRGRILAPKSFSKNRGKDGNIVDNNQGWNQGLDNFVFTNYDTLNTTDNKVIPIQFDLRSASWREIRNNLLESIMSGIGISVGSYASYINDASNRTAREVSAEESGSTLFKEDKRRIIEKPINRILDLVCKFNGYTETVELKWSKAGMTNTTAHSDNIVKLYQAGLMSRENAVRALNMDMDEKQIQAELDVLETAQKAKSQTFSDMDFNTEISEL